MDAFIGLGEKTGGINHDGRSLTMWNNDILAPDVDGAVARSRDESDPEHCPTSDRYDPYYISINLLYHLAADNQHSAAGSFMDNGYRLHYNFSNNEYYEIHGKGGQLTEYIFAGPSIQSILSQYSDLTGKLCAPPLWALGHHQCRWHHYTQNEWEALAEEYRKRRIPCDTLWLDIGYMDEYRVFTWDHERFPEPDKALRRLREKGFRAITIIDPGVKCEPGYAVYDEGRERNLFCKTESGQTYLGQVWPGRTAFPDFVQEETRRWWGRLNAEHVKSGVAGIWNDMNEPATGTVPPYEMRFDVDGRNHTHERYHNQYGLLMAMGTAEGMHTAMPELRTFILSRAGFAGIQRYAANWTGDNCSKWEHLAMSIPMNCSLNLCGQPFVGSDIGGFCGNTTAELLVRWYQYGTFQPFMRNHNIIGADAQYPWSLGVEAEELIKAAIILRYRLLPYIYTCFMLSSETGEPIQRPLIYEFQGDRNVLENNSDFLFGPHMLIAPVTEEGQRVRELYLPPGQWIDINSEVSYDGGRQISVTADLDVCPMFLKAGGLIPTADVVQSTESYAPEKITLLVAVPEEDGETLSYLHEDDGVTYKYQSGEMVRTEFRLGRIGNQLTLKGISSGQGFPEHTRKQFRVRFLGADIPTTVIENCGESFEVQFEL